MVDCFWTALLRTEEDCDPPEPPPEPVPGSGDFIQRAELVGPGGIDEFGRFVAIDAGTAIISFLHAGSGLYRAVVYEGVANVWTVGDTLSETQDLKVQQVAGDLAVFTTDDGVDTGGVYVYTKSGGSWAKLQQLNTPNPNSDNIEVMDAAISDDGEWLAVGVRNATLVATSPGYVDMYKWGGSNFVYSSRIESPNAPGPNEYFGWAVSLSSTGVLFVGAYANGDEGSNRGAGYTYTVSGTAWSLDETFYRSVSASSSRFGYSGMITANGEGLVVGDRVGGAEYYYHDGGGFVSDGVFDNGSGGVGARIAEDVGTGAQFDAPFGSDAEVYIYEYDDGYALTQTLTHDFTIIGGGNFIVVSDLDLRAGQLIFSMTEAESGDGLLDGQGYVYIYSRDPFIDD